MDGISRSRGWDMEIPHGVLPMEQPVLSDKWARIKLSPSGLRNICMGYSNAVYKIKQITHEGIRNEDLRSSGLIDDR